MDMFGMLKNLFGVGEENATARSDLLILLEKTVVSESTCGSVVDNAARLRNMLRRERAFLSHDERVRIVKVLNKAKVRALMQGTSECYGAFRSLDSISNDVVQLL